MEGVNCSAQAAAKCRNCKCRWYSDFGASLSLCKPSGVVFIDNYTTACNCTKYPQIFLISSNIFTGFGNLVRFGGVHDSYSDRYPHIPPLRSAHGALDIVVSEPHVHHSSWGEIPTKKCIIDNWFILF